MSVLAPRSLRGKVLLLVACAASVGVIIESTIMRVIESMEVKPLARAEASAHAAVIAAHSAAALAFEDRDAASETLSALRLQPNVISARIFDRSGDRFSTYLRADSAEPSIDAPKSDGHWFEGAALTVSRPIELDGEPMGTLVIVYDLSEPYGRLRTRALVALVIGAAAIGVALLLGMRLQRGLAGPVRELIAASGRISQTKDYSLRARKFRDDELGRLADSFNAMIAQIEQRDVELIDIQQALKASNEQLRQFAYVASHDLQEPLRMVASYVQLLEQRYADKLDEPAREFIAFAVDGAVRMKQLINDLLAYSRLDTRGGSFAATGVEETLEVVLRDLQAAVRESGAAITHDPLPQVLADATQLRQLLQNLIANAIKFRSQEPPRIHVSAQSNGTQWEFAVRDNGIGIDPQFADRIFVIFQRLHGRDQYPGTGIGLAVCRKIVERHRGRIWVEPAPGGGSIFRFTLPQIKESLRYERQAA